ncbi:VWA domain-containing protein [Shewanella baltica]|uniref:vWA domain-containing protein n=1 Tax=Shewanella baltica TaxID=62322 RepID=UPI00217D2F5C|nr:VWA domain-containing protein [Shewanella baltica]MCS6231532.1 VWA domain-containing protein [Shewanella baltica]
MKTKYFPKTVSVSDPTFYLQQGYGIPSATNMAALLLVAVSLTACGGKGAEVQHRQAKQQAEQRHQEASQRQAEMRDAAKVEMARVAAPMQMSSNGAVMGMSIAPMPRDYAAIPLAQNKFEQQVQNGIMVAGEIPVSTFSIDVDTGSYATLRRMLREGRLPEKGIVRVEEMLNYFAYDYPLPAKNAAPFSVTTELAPSPYNDDMMLLRIGLKGYDLPKSQLGASNLVFLLDVSGSMASVDKLPLLQTALKLLTAQLSAQDKVSIVVYAGAAGVVLDGASGNDTQTLNYALEQLSAGGSTNGGQGITQAYQLAQKHFIPNGINRVILATDGDFNVGVTDFDDLIALIEKEKDHGIGLTTLGFGLGNYNDQLMEQLADKGNGNYAYIDTLNEARKVLVDELSSTLFTIAKDVKVQVEFNPALVSEYRLIGYENRALAREDFNNDKVDAGEIGAGHTVTALYELRYVEAGNRMNDKLRYGVDAQTGKEKYSREEIAFLKLRYKLPAQTQSQLLSYPIRLDQSVKQLEQASDDFRFAAAVAGLGQLLNGSHYLHQFDYTKLSLLARSALGDDPFGYRHEFVQLMETAAAIEQSNQLPIKKTFDGSDKPFPPQDKLHGEPMRDKSNPRNERLQ